MTDLVKVLCGNSAEVLQTLPAGSVDMVLTSPPYDNMRSYKGFEFSPEKVIHGLFTVLRDGGVCVWVVGDQMVKGSETGSSFKQALLFKEAGFNLHDTMIYSKKNAIPNKGNDSVRYHQQFEYMFCFSKGRPKTFHPILVQNNNYGKQMQPSFRNHGKDTQEVVSFTGAAKTKVAGNIFEYSVGYGKTTSYRPAFSHPAVFPERLAFDQIRSWTDDGDCVLDPFCGSGTTVYIAQLLNRRAIGIDIEQSYCDLTLRRIEEEAVPKWFVEDALKSKQEKLPLFSEEN